MSIKPQISPESRSRTRWLQAVLGLVVFAAALLAFGPAFSAPFVGFDDASVLLDVDGYRGFGAENLRWMFSTTHMGHYQPLTWLSYAIDHAFWDLKPTGYHATNVLVHAVNAVLVFVLATQLLTTAKPTQSRLPTLLGACAAALLFAVHPLRAESVAWVTERRDVLSTMFLLAAALAYLHTFRPRSSEVASRPMYALSIALLMLSLLSKAWGMSFFVVMLLVDIYPLERISWSPRSWLSSQGRKVLLQKAPYAILGLIFAAIAAHAQRSTGQAVADLERWTILDRLLQACYGLIFYLHKTVVPKNLAPLYEMPLHMNAAAPAVIAAVVLVPLLTLAIILLSKRLPALPVAAAAYLVIIAPVLGFLQSGPQLVADRYSYVALIGWAITLGAGAATLLERATRPQRGLLLAVAACILMGLGGLTWNQSKLWQDNDKLLTRVAELGYAGPVFRTRYADMLARKGELDQAARVYQDVLAETPHYGEAWAALGSIQRRQHLFTQAEESLKKGLQNHPEPWKPALELGLMYLMEDELNRPDQAIAAFSIAIADVERPNRPAGLNPGGNGRPYLMMAAALDITGDLQGSYAMLQKAAQYAPTREESLARMKDLEAELKQRPQR